MQKLANIDEMCRRSEAGAVMFGEAYESFKKEIQEMATKCVDRCNDAQNSGPGPIDEKRIWDHIFLLKQQAAWSNMQAHHTNVLDFIQTRVVVVIACTESILKQSHSARVQIHPLFNGAASVVLDLENQNR